MRKGLRIFAGRDACFVPRLRWTPFRKEGRKGAPDLICTREAENDRHRDADHAKLRTAAKVATARDYTAARGRTMMEAVAALL
jgi:hypothetical protein